MKAISVTGIDACAATKILQQIAMRTRIGSTASLKYWESQPEREVVVFPVSVRETCEPRDIELMP